MFFFGHHERPQNVVVFCEDVLFLEYSIKPPDPHGPMDCSRQSLKWVSSLTLSANISLGHREIPSAKVFCTPGIWFAWWFHPPASSRRPSILMSRLVLWSVAPPLRDTHDTAAMLSPRIRIGSPAASDLLPTYWNVIHAVTATANIANILIVMVQIS